VVHGIPSAYKLKSGDIVKLDLGLKYKGFYTDTAVTVGVGEVSDEAKQLMAVTKDSLTLAIDQCIVGNTVGDIGFAINSYVRKHGMRVVKGLTGHGIGQHLHEDPVVANVAKPSTGVKLTAGMVIAVEPMVTLGSGETIQLKLDESFATKERVLAAHFEHTIAITDTGPKVLT
jgi:methionyl aminopeptidase